jgi:hypothetical protein
VDPAGSSWARLIAALVAVERGAVGQARMHAERSAAGWPVDPEPDLVALDELVRTRLLAVTLTRSAPPNPRPGEVPIGYVGDGAAGAELAAVTELERYEGRPAPCQAQSGSPSPSIKIHQTLPSGGH